MKRRRLNSRKRLRRYKKTNALLAAEKDRILSQLKALGEEKEKVIASSQSLKNEYSKIQKEYEKLSKTYQESISEKDRFAKLAKKAQDHSIALQSRLNTLSASEADLKSRVKIYQKLVQYPEIRNKIIVITYDEAFDSRANQIKELLNFAGANVELHSHVKRGHFIGGMKRSQKIHYYRDEDKVAAEQTAELVSDIEKVKPQRIVRSIGTVGSASFAISGSENADEFGKIQKVSDVSDWEDLHIYLLND